MKTTHNPDTMRRVGRPRKHNYAAIAADRKSGMTWEEIRAKHRCNDEIISRALHEQGGLKRDKGLDTSAVVRLYAEGKKASEVAKILGCCVLTVHNHLRRKGVKMRRRADYAREEQVYTLTPLGQQIAKEIEG